MTSSTSGPPHETPDHDFSTLSTMKNELYSANDQKQPSGGSREDGVDNDRVVVRNDSDDDVSMIPDAEELKVASGRSTLQSVMLVVTCTTAMILNVRPSSISY